MTHNQTDCQTDLSSDFTKTPNFVLRNMATLSHPEFKLVMAVAHLTYGQVTFRQTGQTGEMAIRFMSDLTGLSRECTATNLKSLVKSGWLQKHKAGKSFRYTVANPLPASQNYPKYQSPTVLADSMMGDSTVLANGTVNPTTVLGDSTVSSENSEATVLGDSTSLYQQLVQSDDSPYHLLVRSKEISRKERKKQTQDPDLEADFSGFDSQEFETMPGSENENHMQPETRPLEVTETVTVESTPGGVKKNSGWQHPAKKMENRFRAFDTARGKSAMLNQAENGSQKTPHLEPEKTANQNSQASAPPTVTTTATLPRPLKPIVTQHQTPQPQSQQPQKMTGGAIQNPDPNRPWIVERIGLREKLDKTFVQYILNHYLKKLPAYSDGKKKAEFVDAQNWLRSASYTQGGDNQRLQQALDQWEQYCTEGDSFAAMKPWAQRNVCVDLWAEHVRRPMVKRNGGSTMGIRDMLAESHPDYQLCRKLMTEGKIADGLIDTSSGQILIDRWEGVKCHGQLWCPDFSPDVCGYIASEGYDDKQYKRILETA